MKGERWGSAYALCGYGVMQWRVASGADVGFWMVNDELNPEPGRAVAGTATEGMEGKKILDSGF